MDDGTTRANPWQAVREAMVTHVLHGLQLVYDDFNVSLERWLNDMVRHPIAENWRDEVVTFVDETERKGLRILPYSIRVIEALIESRIAGTGQFARYGPARRAPAKTVLLAQPAAGATPQADTQPSELDGQSVPAGHPSTTTGHQNFSVGAQQLFDQKVASAKQHFAVLEQLLKVAGEKIDAAKPGEEVDLGYEAEMVNKHLFLYNEDLALACNVWLRFNLSSDGIARLTELVSPMSLGLPMFASPAQAERAREQRIAVTRRLNEKNASMDAWVTGIAAAETAATAVGIVAGAGVLVVAAKKGGAWAVVKTVAAGAAAIAADRAADAGLRAAGASEQAIGGVRLAAAVITLILLHKVAKSNSTPRAAQKLPGTAIVPKSPVELGKWGEARLAHDLGNQGFKPKTGYNTSLGKRFIDRLVNGTAHEAKAGIDAGLTSTIRTQVLKDAELIATNKVRRVVWHFYQGANQELLDFLAQNGIEYVVHR